MNGNGTLEPAEPKFCHCGEHVIQNSKQIPRNLLIAVIVIGTRLSAKKKASDCSEAFGVKRCSCDYSRTCTLKYIWSGRVGALSATLLTGTYG